MGEKGKGEGEEKGEREREGEGRKGGGTLRHTCSFGGMDAPVYYVCLSV